MTIEFESAVELARKIRARKISSRELTDLYIGRIERHEKKLSEYRVAAWPTDELAPVSSEGSRGVFLESRGCSPTEPHVR